MSGRIAFIVLAVLEVEVTHRITVDAIDGQNNHDCEVGQQQRSVKEIPVVKALKSPVGFLESLKVMPKPSLRSENQVHCPLRWKATKQAGSQASSRIQTIYERGEQGVPPSTG